MEATIAPKPQRAKIANFRDCSVYEKWIFTLFELIYFVTVILGFCQQKSKNS